MNLLKIQDKLKAREYRTVEEVLDHIQLVWDNCKAYNPEGHYYVLADKLERQFKKMIRNYLPNIQVVVPSTHWVIKNPSIPQAGIISLHRNKSHRSYRSPRPTPVPRRKSRCRSRMQIFNLWRRAMRTHSLRTIILAIWDRSRTFLCHRKTDCTRGWSSWPSSSLRRSFLWSSRIVAKGLRSWEGVAASCCLTIWTSRPLRRWT